LPYFVEIATTEASAGTTIYVKEHGKSLVRDSLLFNRRTKDIPYCQRRFFSNTITLLSASPVTTSAVWNQGRHCVCATPALAETDSPAGGTQRWRTAVAVNSRIYT